jgi:hypothetical protein
VIGVVVAIKQGGAIAIGQQHSFFARAYETSIGRQIQVYPAFNELGKVSLRWYMQHPMGPDACMQTPEPLFPFGSCKRQNLSLDLCTFFHFMLYPTLAFT